MTDREKQIISLLCLECSRVPGQEIVIHCSDANARAEDFKFCDKASNNCRGKHYADFDDFSVSFSTGSFICFVTCDGCHGCDKENEKESEVQEAFEEALRNMGKKDD